MQLKSKCNSLLLLLILLVTVLGEFVDMSITLSPTTIATPATYTFNINRQFDPVTPKFISTPSPVPLNSIVRITLPNDYSSLSTSLACTNADTSQLLACTLDPATRTITVSDYYSTSSTLANGQLKIQISNIMNGERAVTSGKFAYSIIAPNTAVIDQGPPLTSALAPSVTFTTASFTSCRISASGAPVGSLSTITLTITPKNYIPSNGVLVVTFPSSWSDDPLSRKIIDSTPTCTSISNLNPTITCSYTTGSDVVTISGLSSSQIVSTFSLSISGITLPPTVGSPSTVSINSQWSDGIRIDQCQAKVDDMISAPFQAITFNPSTTTVQSTLTATLSLKLSRTFSNADTVLIQLPSVFSGALFTASNFVSIKQDAIGSSIILSDFPTDPSTIIVGNSIIFTITNIKNPISAQPVTLKASFRRDNRLYMQSSVSYTASSGMPTSYSILGDSQLVHAYGPATVTISSSLTIPANSVIRITYPASVVAPDVSQRALISAALSNSAVSGTFSVSSNAITILGLFSSPFQGTLTFKLGLFNNPISTQPQNYSLLITSNNFAVMTGSTSVTATVASLVSASVSPSSFTVLQSGVTYSAPITSNHPFTSITIQLPPQITVASGFQTTCAPNTFSSCSLSGSTLTFTGTHPKGSYTLSWGSVTNPNSLSPTSPFLIRTYSDGWLVQRSPGVITITMTQTASLRNFVLFPSSYKNSATIGVNFIMVFPSGAPPGDLLLTFPNQLNIQSASCPSCTIVPPSIMLSLSTISNLTLLVSNVINVGSFQPVSNFIVTLTSTNGYMSIMASRSGWTNTITSGFSSVVSGNNNFRGEGNSFKFVLTGLSGAQSSVRVAIDSSFPQMASVPSGSTLVAPRIVMFSCSALSCTYDLPLTNPTLQGTYTFALTSWLGSFAVGQSTSNSWTFNCPNTTCRSCIGVSCQSCYSSALTSFTILNSSNSQCISACSSGNFLVNLICSPCDSNCSQCINTSTTCTQCRANFFLQTTFNVCVPKCPSGYYENTLSQRCALCQSPCLTCQGSATHCLRCIVNYHLLDNQCYWNCPTGKYINNAVSRTCDPCNANCLTCSGTTTSCLSCNNTINLYLQVNKCVSVCSNNYFLQLNTCVYCQNPCKTCTQSSTTCTSCFLNSTSPIYFNRYCIGQSSCPIGHFINRTNSSCQACIVNCTVCTAIDICSQCSGSYYLLNNKCLLTCPNTHYASSNTSSAVCLPCVGCLTCTTATNCTSCLPSQYLYQAICYSTCPNGSYPSGLVCLKCPTDCPTCRNSSFCLTCTSSLLLLQGACYSSCPSSTYPNISLAQCQQCPIQCSICSSPTSCSSCSNGFSLQLSSCVRFCSKGISVNQTCYPCGLNCLNCLNTTCLRCDLSYYLYDNTCLSQCPSNTLSLDSISCVLCTQKYLNCSTCNNIQCLTCAYGQLRNGSCLPCSPGFYSDNSQCTRCPSSCTTCLSLTHCYTCADNFFLLGNRCSSSCPLNMIPNASICVQCQPYCSICNTTTLRCKICQTSKYQHLGQCLQSCPDPLVISYDATNCVTKQQFFAQFVKAARIVYFPFTIAGAIIVAIIVILKCINKQMHLSTTLCGLICFAQLFAWIIFIGFEYIYWTMFKVTSFHNLACGAAGLLLLILINFIHLRCYCKYIRSDAQYNKWHKNSWCAHNTILTISTGLTFKHYRLLHSKFMGREELSMLLTSTNILIPFSLLGFISIFLCSAPVLVGCALALYNSISRDQQFFIALDTLLITCMMILLLLMDLRHPNDYFVDQHEALNLKKKMYQEEEYSFNGKGDEGEEKKSMENMIEISMDQGDMNMPDSGNKFQSTMAHNANAIGGIGQPGTLAESPGMLGINTKSDVKAGRRTRRRGNKDSKVEDQIGSQVGSQAELAPKQQQGQAQDIIQNSQGQASPRLQTALNTASQQTKPRVSPIDSKLKALSSKWIARQYDNHGYLIKRDSNNNPTLIDSLGYTVVIDDKGQHHKYNQKGEQMKLVNGKYQPHDKEGYRLKDGKKFDQRGYQVRDEDGEIKYYDQRGLRVVKQNGEEKFIDQEGNQVKIGEDGEQHKYQEDGYQLVQHNGQKLLKNQQGQFVRKNDQGKYEMYDPQDGFTVKKDQQTGQYHKYNHLGLRVTKDQYGQLHYHDSQGYNVTILPGDQLVRYDQDGYRIQKDNQGKIHKYDDEGYQLVEDQHGNPYFKDCNGYRVERDIYGKVTLYDEQGFIVKIDQQGKHLKYNQEGLLVTQDRNGQRVLMDKRGRIVKEDGQSYEKYDQEGNKIWLDKDGYEVEEDQEGNINRYDKVGDRVDTEYQIQQQDQFQNTLINPSTKSKANKYKYKSNKQFNQQAALNQLLSKNQVFTFDQGEQLMSDLQQFHQGKVPVVEVDYQLQKMLVKQRNDLVFVQDRNDEQLDDFAEKVEDQLPQGHAQDILNGNPIVQKDPMNKLNNDINDFDQEAIFNDLQTLQPDILKLRNKQMKRANLAHLTQQNRSLHQASQHQHQMKSIADASINQRSFDNQGVQPIQNQTQYGQVQMQGVQIGLGRKRNNRSEMSLINNKKDTQTVYNYNTVEVQIKNKQIYDSQQEIQSLHEDDWNQQTQPMGMVANNSPNISIVKDHHEHTSNANTNILHFQQDALSDFVHQSQHKSRRSQRYVNSNGRQKQGESIQQIEEELFSQAREKAIRERREFRLSGAPNPLVEYAKRMEKEKRSLQEKMYLDQQYKR